MNAALPEAQRRQRRQPRQRPRHSRLPFLPEVVIPATGAGGRQRADRVGVAEDTTIGCGMRQSGCEVLQPEGCAKAANAK